MSDPYNDWYRYEIVVGDGEVIDDFEAYNDTEATRKAREGLARVLQNAWPKSKRASIAKKIRYARLMKGIADVHGDLTFKIVGKYPFTTRWRGKRPWYGRDASRQPTRPRKRKRSRRDPPRPYAHRFRLDGAPGSDSMLVAVDRAQRVADEQRREVRIVDAQLRRVVFIARPYGGDRSRSRSRRDVGGGLGSKERRVLAIVDSGHAHSKSPSELGRWRGVVQDLVDGGYLRRTQTRWGDRYAVTSRGSHAMGTFAFARSKGKRRGRRRT